MSELSALVAFLNRCIAEDEAVAEAAQGHEILAETTDEGFAHAFRWSTARVLAECAAKRRLIETIVVTVHRADRQLSQEWGSPPEGTAELMLCLLAQPYAVRPDFNPAWRLS